MSDHDQRMKELLREFFWELLTLFLPWLARRLVRDKLEWQKQELFTNPPLGLVRRLDLLALVEELTGKGRLLNVEVESANSLTDVRKKVGQYYPFLRTQRNLPVTTLAVYLFVGLDGVGQDSYVEREEGEAGEAEEVYRVNWHYVGLPALSAEEYLACDNWLGVALASLMKIDAERKPWLRAEILRRLATECRENDYRKLLLINCVDAYLPMQGEQRALFDELFNHDARYREARSMIMTTYEKGKCAALQAMVLRLGGKSCGKADENTRKRIEDIEDLARLENLVEAAPAAQSWDELLASN